MIVTPFLCREEATRTPDPHVPNVVRYQLRYFSSVVIDLTTRFIIIKDYLLTTKSTSAFSPFLSSSLFSTHLLDP